MLMASPALAADYTIIVSNYDVSSEQQTVIFSEKHIAPGFNKDYEIKIDNRSDVRARVVLDNIRKVTPSNSNLAEAMGLKLTYNGTEIAVGKYYEGGFNNRELTCVPAGSQDLIAFNLNLPTSAGNEFQGDSFELEFTFKIDQTGCAATPNDYPALPNTGQSQALFTFLYWVVGISFVTTIILGIMLLVGRRRKEDDETLSDDSEFTSIYEKPQVTRKSRKKTKK